MDYLILDPNTALGTFLKSDRMSHEGKISACHCTITQSAHFYEDQMIVALYYCVSN